jgi:hypothetical protein
LRTASRTCRVSNDCCANPGIANKKKATTQESAAFTEHDWAVLFRLRGRLEARREASAEIAAKTGGVIEIMAFRS